MTDTTTQAVTALLDGVTPGPWHFDGQAWNLIIWSSNENRVCFMAHSNGLNDDRDFATAAFIAAARDLVPALLAERDALAAQLAAAEARAREASLDALAAYGQAADAHAAQLAAEAKLATALEAARKAHESLWELNPDNYDHDEVCKLNDGSVEAILTLAPIIGETHGKTPEWWASRALAKGDTPAR